MPKGDNNKIRWTKKMIRFIKANYERMSNKEIADSLGLKIQTLRPKLYELGLYRIELEYWTYEQFEFLKLNYKKIGDKELAEIFQQKWPKKKTWHLKHIEKKRKYLKLNRTQKQLAAIKERNRKRGCWVDITKQTPELIAKRAKAMVALNDNYVAGMITHNDPQLREEIKKHPEILEAQRLKWLLARKIKAVKKHEKQLDSRTHRNIETRLSRKDSR